MKIKPFETILIGLACCAVLFTAGFFTGRLTAGHTIYVSGSGSTVTTQRLSVPTEEPEEDITPVNINTADEEALCALPGIGPELAGAIVEYRQEHGSYTVTAELMNVSGIGQATYDRLKALVTVSDQPVSDSQTKGGTP